MKLTDAITAVEQTQADLAAKDGALDTAGTKLQAAQAAFDTAKADDLTATQAADAALDQLIAAATAAKRSNQMTLNVSTISVSSRTSPQQ